MPLSFFLRSIFCIPKSRPRRSASTSQRRSHLTAPSPGSPKTRSSRRGPAPLPPPLPRQPPPRPPPPRLGLQRSPSTQSEPPRSPPSRPEPPRSAPPRPEPRRRAPPRPEPPRSPSHRSEPPRSPSHLSEPPRSPSHLSEPPRSPPPRSETSRSPSPRPEPPRSPSPRPEHPRSPPPRPEPPRSPPPRPEAPRSPPPRPERPRSPPPRPELQRSPGWFPDHATQTFPAETPADPVCEIVDSNRSGVVAAVKPLRGFAFIAVDGEPGRPTYSANLFVHKSDIDAGLMTRGEAVRFDVARGDERGPRAVNVRSRPPPSEESSCSSEESLCLNLGAAAPLTVALSSETSPRLGTVVQYDVDHRFGVIKCFDTGRQFLAQRRDFRPPLTALRTGQVVEFEVIAGPKGRPAAGNVEVIIDAPDAADLPSDDPLTVAMLPAAQEDLTTAFSEEFTCIICFELLPADAVETPCEHYFCRECIECWLEVQSLCPTCKGRVVRSQLEPIPRGIKNLIQHMAEQQK